MSALSRRAALVATLVLSLVMVTTIAGPASAAPPVPSVNIDCTKLGSATNPPKSFPVRVTQRSAAAMDSLHWGGIPESDVIRMAGGISCEWSNGLKLDGGWTPGGVGVRVEYLPNAADGYWRWASWGGITTPESWSCVIGGCQFMSAAGGDWLYVSIVGARSESVANSLAVRIRTALQLGRTTLYTPPTYATYLDHTCAEIARPVAWQHATASRTALRPFPAPPGWTVLHSAMDVIRSPFCVYADATGGLGAGTLQTLPGGEWSFNALRSSLTTPGPLTAITVPGMRAGDTAYTRCDPGRTTCILDVLIATHWIQVTLPAPGMGGELIRTDRLVAIRVILSEIVLQVYA